MIRFLGRRKSPSAITELPATQPRRGRAIYSYLREPLGWPDGDDRFQGHSNKWESREIARLLQEKGYQLSAIDWADHQTVPPGSYDLIFDIDVNLQRLADRSHGPKLLHLTGSYGPYQNLAELRRIQALQTRRRTNYEPKRAVEHLELTEQSLELADACSLIGNQHTLATYPEAYHPKITLVTVSSSEPIPRKEALIPRGREYLWYFGSGAVHKGLDLLLEIFAARSELTLNIVGNISSDTEFLQIYQRELSLPNIHFHGFLSPLSLEFRQILDRSFCFLAPSCSESISTAAATCLRIGLFPIVSRQTGVTLPEGAGIYLEDCSIPEIEAAIERAYYMTELELSQQIIAARDRAEQLYSREAFTAFMSSYLTKVVPGRD